MSGYTHNVIAENGTLEEGLSFLQKPFTPKALAQRVRETLDRPPVAAD
jgi:DNA-binding response OmpR family regulator